MPSTIYSETDIFSELDFPNTAAPDGYGSQSTFSAKIDLDRQLLLRKIDVQQLEVEKLTTEEASLREEAIRLKAKCDT